MVARPWNSAVDCCYEKGVASWNMQAFLPQSYRDARDDTVPPTTTSVLTLGMAVFEELLPLSADAA